MGQLVVTSLAAFHGSQRPAASADELERAIELWRGDMHQLLAGKAALDWQDRHGTEVEAFPWPELADRALKALAAYAEATDLEWPDTVPTDLEGDPAWQRSSANDFGRTRWAQLMIPSVWLPGSFHLSISAALPDGEPAIFGSVDGLREQLQRLNECTMQLPLDPLREEGRRPAPTDGELFLPWARHGFAVLLAACSRASERSLPLLAREGSAG